MLKKLRNREAAIVAQMRAMQDKLGAEDRVAFDPDEQKEFDAMSASLAEVQTAIKREEALLAAEKALVPVVDVNAAPPQQRREFDLNALRGSRPKHWHGEGAALSAYRAGQWTLGVLFGRQQALSWLKDHAPEMLAMSSTDNAKGGVLVPDEMASTIIDLREQYGVFRRNARVVPMGSDSLTIARRTGGLTAYFVSESSEVTASDPTWDAVTLTARKLAVMSLYPSELAEDAVISIADWVAQEMAYAFALKEDQCGFIGTGTSTYGGINGVANKINSGSHSASVADAASGNVSFETLDLEDFEKALGKLPRYALNNAKWYVSAYGFANSMARLMYAGGGNTVQTIGGGTGPSFLGYPVEISQVLNSTAGSDTSAIKCLFGDLSMAATMGSRRDLRVMASSERYFEKDQIAILGTQRFDIVVHDLGDTSSAGPIVAVKTAAS